MRGFENANCSGMKAKNFRKRRVDVEDGDEEGSSVLALEEVKFLQKQREKKSGIPAHLISPPSAAEGATGGAAGIPSGLAHPVKDKIEGDVDNDDLVLQDTFAQETAVVEEDPNMLKYVEQELAKKRGKNIGNSDNQAENEFNRAEDELYKIPEHLKVKKRRGSSESSTQWTTGIAEIQLPIEYKLRNIEETEAAKKLLQEKRIGGRGKADFPEKLRNDQLSLYKEKGVEDGGLESRHSGSSSADGGGGRQAATDQIMLERFRKRERQRQTRR